MAQLELVGGIPVATVIGTPRTMGEKLGHRFKPRLQVLAQYLAQRLTAAGADVAAVRRRLRQAMLPQAQHDPALGMELESVAASAELAIEDLLLIHGHADILSAVGAGAAVAPSTFVSLSGTRTASGNPLMATVWELDPALLPYLALLHRIPAHGPANISLTLAGVHPVAGLSEAVLAVASDELRVIDGGDGVFTTHMVASMLLAPGFDDALRRASATPRWGGRTFHLLDRAGERATLEASGQRTARLPDPIAGAPRVHTNHAIDEAVLATLAGPDGASKGRLERIAGHAVKAESVTVDHVLAWFGFGAGGGDEDDSSAARRAAERVVQPTTAVAMVIDPAARELHVRLGDVVETGVCAL